MSFIDSVFEALSEVAETIAIDGVAGFVPLVTVARLIIASGAMRDTGRGEPTRRQLQYLKSQLSRFPDQLEFRIRKDGVYLRLL